MAERRRNWVRAGIFLSVASLTTPMASAGARDPAARVDPAEAQAAKTRLAAGPPAKGGTGDIPSRFSVPTSDWDYEKRDVMIPMRDGVRLHAVVIVPYGLHRAPIMLDRTPYSATKFTSRATSSDVADILTGLSRELVQHGYIVVVEDVRGKYGSGGDYVMNRPLSGPLNPTKVDHSTDAYDTIDWLVKHVAETNGRVGTIGTSYDGFTVLMSLVHPHPALKAAVPINPMVDTWIGDDWFHHGAFRQEMMDYIYFQTATKDSSLDWPTSGYDDWAVYLDHVSAGALGRAKGMEQLAFWRRLTAHPAYDAFWQDQAVDRILGRQTLTVPTLFVQAQWDQEDIYGAVASYEAVAGNTTPAGLAHLVIGPWHHGQANGKASSLGALQYGADTGAWFRRHVLFPFLDENLKDAASRVPIAPVIAYQTGTDTWRAYPSWPVACANCADKGRALYLEPDGGLGFAAPAASGGYDEYISDPAKPVPYRPRPIRPTYAEDSTWRTWLVDDQRFADGRPDVLTFRTGVLKASVAISGAPVAHLLASTTGTDADWVVKLIDVYPDDVATQPGLGGYELPVAMDILRGRYRDDPAHPSPIPAGAVVPYTLPLPNVNHVFLPGHRIMVQIQSSWFPLYDRNPQRYVPNVFFASAGDYVRATDRVYHDGAHASFLQLPIVPVQAGTVIGGD